MRNALLTSLLILVLGTCARAQIGALPTIDDPQDADRISTYTRGFAAAFRLDTLRSYFSQGGVKAGDVTLSDTALTVARATNLQDWAERVDVALLNARSTGIRFGAMGTVTGPTEITFSAGAGQILDNTDAANPRYYNMTWPETAAQLAITNTAIVYWMIDTTGTLVQQTAPPSRVDSRTHILLGRSIFVGGSIVGFASTTVMVQQGPSNLRDLSDALGLFIVSGCRPELNAPNLTFLQASGELFKLGGNYADSYVDPNVVDFPVLNPASFRYITSVGGSVGTVDVNDVDPNFYDVNGTRTAITNNLLTEEWTVQRIYIFDSGLMRIQYGTQVYTSKADAFEGFLNENYTTNPSLVNGIVVGALLVARGATNLSDANQAGLVITDKFGNFTGGGSAVTGEFVQGVTGTAPIVVNNADPANPVISISSTDDADADPTNELYDDTEVRDSLAAHRVDIDALPTDADVAAAQQAAQDYADANDNVNDADADPANELQTISISGDQLTLNQGGGTVTVPTNTGPPGADGQDGADGISPTVTVGSTTTGSPGTNATVTDTDAGPDVVLNFTIPRGIPGQDGADGSVWRSGVGIPDNSLGVDGDYYLRTDQFGPGEVYRKAGGSYSLDVNIQGPAGQNGADGQDGTDGLGWTSGSYNATTGVVTFNSNDGLGFSTGDLRGADGADGANGQDGADGAPGADGTDGRGIVATSYDAGTGVLTFTFSDATQYSTPDIRGADGQDGADGVAGADGQDGRGIVSTSYDAGAGTVTFTFSDGGTFTTGDLRGADGAQGPPGDPATDDEFVTSSGTAPLNYDLNSADLREPGVARLLRPTNVNAPPDQDFYYNMFVAQDNGNGVQILWPMDAFGGGTGILSHRTYNASNGSYTGWEQAGYWQKYSTNGVRYNNAVYNSNTFSSPSFLISNDWRALDIDNCFEAYEGNILRTRLRFDGAQKWFLKLGNGNEAGSIGYTTPGGNPGIVFFNANEEGRTQMFQDSPQGGLSFGTSATAANPGAQMTLTTSGNLNLTGVYNGNGSGLTNTGIYGGSGTVPIGAAAFGRSHPNALNGDARLEFGDFYSSAYNTRFAAFDRVGYGHDLRSRINSAGDLLEAYLYLSDRSTFGGIRYTGLGFLTEGGGYTTRGLDLANGNRNWVFGDGTNDKYQIAADRRPTAQEGVSSLGTDDDGNTVWLGDREQIIDLENDVFVSTFPAGGWVNVSENFAIKAGRTYTFRLTVYYSTTSTSQGAIRLNSNVNFLSGRYVSGAGDNVTTAFAAGTPLSLPNSTTERRHTFEGKFQASSNGTLNLQAQATGSGTASETNITVRYGTVLQIRQLN